MQWLLTDASSPTMHIKIFVLFILKFWNEHDFRPSTSFKLEFVLVNCNSLQFHFLKIMSIYIYIYNIRVTYVRNICYIPLRFK